MTSNSPTSAGAGGAKPPRTRRDDVSENLHGVTVIDPYRWLEDQESPETRRWVEEQDAYTHSLLDPWPGRDVLRRRLEELLKIDTIGLPVARGSRYFYTMRPAERDQPLIYLRQGLRGPEEALIDPGTLGGDSSTSVSLLDVSGDGSLLAYGIRQGGRDEVEVRLFDVDARADRTDRLPSGRYFGGVSLMPDGSALYYGRAEADGPRVYHHMMGTDPAGDELIFGEGCDPGKIIGVGVSEDGHWLLITVYHGSAAQKTEVHLRDLSGNGPVEALVNDIDAQFLPEIGGDNLFLVTDWGAPNKRILRVDLNSRARSEWKSIVPERPDAAIEGVSAVGGRLFINYLKNVIARVEVFESDGTPVRMLRLPGRGSAGELRGSWSRSEAFFMYTSFTVPPTIYRCDTATGARRLWARLRAPVEPTAFQIKQVFYRSKDGTRIPMFLVHAKGLKLDGKRPTYLYGYGGFGLSLTPAFSSRAVLWAENGGVFAIANLRGGGEFGEAWHRDGMLGAKQNVFDDFLCAAESLIANGYTSPDHLAIAGGSNGGLLVGAALTQRPELFRAVVCSVPLLDMIRYHQFLVARFWVPEYGSSEDPEQFKTLYAYSPYHRVKSGVHYPAVLFMTGDSDTRVAPLHARKMAALLQAATGSNRPVLLHYDTRSGHSGGQPITKTIDDMADEQSFLFRELGVVPVGSE